MTVNDITPTILYSQNNKRRVVRSGPIVGISGGSAMELNLYDRKNEGLLWGGEIKSGRGLINDTKEHYA